MRENFELYKAVKYQAEEYSSDYGYSLPELWKIVQTDKWWREVCKADYKNEVIKKRTSR